MSQPVNVNVDPNEEITIVLSAKDIMTIMTHLQKGTYGEVNSTISSVQSQVQNHFQRGKGSEAETSDFAEQDN